MIKKNISKFPISCLLTPSILLTSWLGYANPSYSQTVSEAQRNLQQLDRKIAVLRQDLTQTHNQQNQVQQQLDATTKQMSVNANKLHELQQKIQEKQAEIPHIEQQVAESRQQFAQLQALLMKQLQARYKQEPNQPLAWFLVHPKKSEIDQILTYYQYILHSHEHTLQQLKMVQGNLETLQAHLKQEIENLHHLQAQAQIEQQQLEVYKNHHTALLNTVHQQVVAQENTLSEYQRNRDNLSQILNKLGRESVIQTRHSMTTMKRKLPTPVTVDTQQIQKIHQGIMLYSSEGSVVHAVYPGKVVFGEWLNGYGLLIIVDHGWGLMTLYANNLSLTKHVGEIVNQGEQIATVGHGGIAKESGLYFEVRKHGKAIPPLDWLGHA